MTTITNGATVITPDTVDGYEATRASRNLIHAIIGRADVDVTLQPAALRTGTLELKFKSKTAAWAAVTALAVAGRFVLADTDVPQINMTFVVSGDIAPALEDETRNGWAVAVAYQEVTT